VSLLVKVARKNSPIWVYIFTTNQAKNVCGVQSFPQETLPKLDNKSGWLYNSYIN
jgi:hypothetical protein